MLAPKKSKFTSVVRLHLNVISIFSVVIGIGLQNGCIESVASEAQNVSLEYIEKTCIEKCADQVSENASAKKTKPHSYTLREKEKEQSY